MRILSITPRNKYIAINNHWIHKLPGGAIGETGPHVIYMSLAFVKNVRNIRVVARKTTNYPWVLYDDYRIVLEGENINSSIYVSHASNYRASEVELFGTKYALRIDLLSMLLIRYKKKINSINAVSSTLNSTGQMVINTLLNVLKVMLHKPMLGHYILIERFVQSVINDETVPVTPEEGRETVRILEEIVKNIAKS